VARPRVRRRPGPAPAPRSPAGRARRTGLSADRADASRPPHHQALPRRRSRRGGGADHRPLQATGEDRRRRLRGGERATASFGAIRFNGFPNYQIDMSARAKK